MDILSSHWNGILITPIHKMPKCTSLFLLDSSGSNVALLLFFFFPLPRNLHLRQWMIFSKLIYCPFDWAFEAPQESSTMIVQ